MNKIKLVVMFIAAVCLTNCSKEDTNFQVTGVSQIDSDQGSRFTFTYPDGTERKVSGSTVFGSFNGQLLDRDYYKSFHGSAAGQRFDFRFSIPKNTQAADVIEGLHQLRSQRLTLQRTGNLGKLETEFWLGTTNEEDEFNGLVNAVGTATYQQNIKANDQIIKIVVEVDVEVVNREGQTVKIKGIFWKAKDDDIR